MNAHGSSTPLNDKTETLAFKRAFGAHAAKLAVSGTKGYYGHPLGASGAIEAAITALALARRWLPPTLNLRARDPECDLGYLARARRGARRARSRSPTRSASAASTPRSSCGRDG